jgi:hypothetical protein
MTHPNALPDDKTDYVYSLHQQKRLRVGLGISLPQLALLMYHCEVPYGQACSFLEQLSRSGFRTPAMPEQMPDAQLQRLFDACGAGHAETAQFIATLNTKR